MKKLLISAVMATVALTASAQSKSDTLVVTTDPIMHCEGCENKIKNGLRFVKGIKKVKTNVPDQRVTIIYNGFKATKQDYIAALEKMGYKVEEVIEK